MIVRSGRIDAATWSVAEAADALEVQCACAENRLRSAYSIARQRAERTKDDERAKFWREVSELCAARRHHAA